MESPSYFASLQKLGFTVTPDESLPGRDKELAVLRTFLENFLSYQTVGATMFISGVPGTGKTATVTRALSDLCQRDFQLMVVNGMEVARPAFIYQEIYRQLNGTKKRIPSPSECLAQLDRTFRGKTAGQARATAWQRRPRILVVDEIDYLVTRDQKILYSLLEWPNLPTAALCLVAISNTMNLPDLLMARCTSRFGNTRLDFHAYTAPQIEVILRHRLESAGKTLFSKVALDFCARKVAGYSGDLRRGLYICRRALELQQAEDPTQQVSMKYIKAAENELYTRPEFEVIQQLPFFSKLLLTVLVLAVKGHPATPVTKEQPKDADSSVPAVSFYDLTARFSNMVSCYKGNMADIRDTSYASTYALVRHLVLKLQEYHFVNVYQSVPDAAEQLAAPPKSNPAKSNANGKNLAADGDSDVAHLRTIRRKALNYLVDEIGGDTFVNLNLEVRSTSGFGCHSVVQGCFLRSETATRGELPLLSNPKCVAAMAALKSSK